MTYERRPTVRPDLLLTVVGDDVLAYDAPARTSHLLNTSAAAVLGECDGRSSIDEIADRLARSFPSEAVDVRASVHSLIPDLDEANLLATEPAERAEVAIGDRLPRPSSLEDLHRRCAESRDWAWIGGPYRALGFGFEVWCDVDEDQATYLDTVLDSLRASDDTADDTADDTTHRYLIRHRRQAGARDRTSTFDLTLDGHSVGRGRPASSLPGHLLWHINRMAVVSRPDRVVLHAAGASCASGTVVLPGASESGKSTLVTGLVREGWSYLSDEALALVPGTTEVEPYPRPITLDRGSWDVHAALRPTDPGREQFETNGWQIPPESVRPGAIGDAAPVDLLVFPTYETDVPTTTTRVSPSDALVDLLAQTFGLGEPGQAGLDTLAMLAEEVPAYRLISSDLAGAIGAITTLLDGGRSGSPPAG